MYKKWHEVQEVSDKYNAFFYTSMCYFGLILILCIIQFRRLQFCYKNIHFIHIYQLTEITYIPTISLRYVSDLRFTTSYYFNLKLRQMFRHNINNPFYIY